MKYYAGIGSRDASYEACAQIAGIARRLDKLGYTLRSGGAKGADKAWELNSTRKEIFRPEHSTLECEFVAATVHPNWAGCTVYTRQLHGRNVKIVIGNDLKTPVEFVVAWARYGKAKGGSSLALRLADKMHIPNFNLLTQASEFEAFLKGLEQTTQP